MSTRLPKWERAVALHVAAAAELAAAAEAIAPEDWEKPRADDKWSPAQVVEHLNQTYDTLLRELEGGDGMRVRTKTWQRLLLRWTLVPKILRGAGFPPGARAPRELRPADAPNDRPALLAAFRERAARFDSEVCRAYRERPRTKLTHAYFGSAPLAKSVLLCARHIEHHRAQLP